MGARIEQVRPRRVGLDMFGGLCWKFLIEFDPRRQLFEVWVASWFLGIMEIKGVVRVGLCVRAYRTRGGL